MKRIASSLTAFAVVLLSQVVYAETVAETINRRLGLNLNEVSIGEGFGKQQLIPRQVPLTTMQTQKVAPALQAPQKMELQAAVQAPSKLVSAAVIRPVKHCSLIPGRAHRMARRAARQELRAQAALSGKTLLEIDSPRTVMENGTCTSCTSGGVALTSEPARARDIAGSTPSNVPIMLTSLTTRELLEGGQINRQIRTVNEPGVCGGGGGGGRRGLLGRRG